MPTPRLILVATMLAAAAAAGVVRGQAQKPEKPMEVVGWERTVSTVAFKGGLKGYYAEMEAQLQ